MVTTTYPDSTTLGQGYDGAGNVISKTDQAGKTTKYSYDEANRLKSVSIPITQSASNYQVTNYDYDTAGKLRFIIDANTHKTEFQYDALGRQIKKVWPDNSFEQYGYDAVGNRTSQRLSDGNTNTFLYDELNRLKQISYFDGGVLNYAYTPTGQRQSATDTRGTTSYSYDNRDRVTSIIQAGTGLTVTYGYDANSNRTGLTTKAGATSYTYYDDNRLKTVVGPNDPAGTQSTFYYYPNGLRQQLSLANGVIVQYTYDPLNRLTNMQAGKNGLTLLSAYTYTLGLAGNRVGVVEAASGVVTSTKAWSYDDAYRLTSETITNTGSAAVTTFYQYDKTGNRLSMQSGSLVSTYNYNELDQLTSVISGSSTTLYSYKRGNLVQVKQGSTVQSSYTWDGADRLIAAMVSGGSASYKYDADSRRVQQVANGVTTNYLWDEFSAYGDVVVEANTSNAVQTSYVLGQGDLISQNKLSGGLSYFLKDGQGSVRSLTDGNGNLISGENYSFDAFGNLKNGPVNPTSNYLYTGQQYDSLTKLYDLRARYYNPADGRFLSQDIVNVDTKNPFEVNRYVYSANNPINYSDPSGYRVAGGTLGDYGSILDKISFSTVVKAGLITLGITAITLVAATVASITYGHAQSLYQKALDALSAANFDIHIFNSFTVIIAIPTFTDGSTVTYLAISNYFSANPRWDQAFKIIRNALQGQGNILPESGSFEYTNPGEEASHAEKLMVAFLRAEKRFWLSPQAIPGAVSGYSCNQCRIGARNIRPGIWEYDIDIENGRHVTYELSVPGIINR